MSGQRRTPLFDLHQEAGARFVDFAGWQMPVLYRSILDEHRAVRTSCGLFDVSHMGEFWISGPGARDLLDLLLTNDFSTLQAGRARYSPMCREDGGTLDDLIVYCAEPDRFLLCVNAANTATDLAWIREQAGRLTTQPEISDLSESTALLALQGPLARRILQRLTPAPLDQVPGFGFLRTLVAGRPAWLARTGYTGEDGFELFLDNHHAGPVATALLEAGRPEQLGWVGLGARDSLRTEAGYPLYGHELDTETSPIAAGLGWTVKLDKTRACIGSDALRAERERGCEEVIRWFRTGDRRIVRPGSLVQSGGALVGSVRSGTLSPSLNESIGSAKIRRDATDCTAEVRGAQLPLLLTKPPFLKLDKTSP